MNDKRSKSLGMRLKCADGTWSGRCFLKGSIRGGYCTLSIEGGDGWAHLTTDQVYRLRSFLESALEEMPAPKSEHWGRDLVRRTEARELQAVVNLAFAQLQLETMLEDFHFHELIVRPTGAADSTMLRSLLRLAAERGIKPEEKRASEFAKLIAGGGD